jgi:transposase
MIDFSLSKRELLELEAFHKTIRDKKIADRLKAIIALGQGIDLSEIAKILLLDESTIYRYWKIYKNKGIKDLVELNFKGRIPKLREEDEKKLIKHLEENTYTSSKQIVDYVKRKFGKTFTNEGMVITLHRLGFSYKRPKVIPSKADSSAQKEFIDRYKKLREDLKSNEKIYFMDGCHPTHNVISSYGWIKKGSDKEIKSNTGRKRINLNGLYSPLDMEILVIEDETINAQSTIKLLKLVEQKHPELEKIFIIRDNARYYSCKLVQEYLKTSRIEMIGLPTYSPNLNLIERLWKFFKKIVLYNKYYEKFSDFRKSVLDFFDYDIRNYRKDLLSLMTENFNIISA